MSQRYPVPALAAARAAVALRMAEIAVVLLVGCVTGWALAECVTP